MTKETVSFNTHNLKSLRFNKASKSTQERDSLSLSRKKKKTKKDERKQEKKTRLEPHCSGRKFFRERGAETEFTSAPKTSAVKKEKKRKTVLETTQPIPWSSTGNGLSTLEQRSLSGTNFARRRKKRGRGGEMKRAEWR